MLNCFLLRLRCQWHFLHSYCRTSRNSEVSDSECISLNKVRHLETQNQSLNFLSGKTSQISHVFKCVSMTRTDFNALGIYIAERLLQLFTQEH